MQVAAAPEQRLIQQHLHVYISDLLRLLGSSAAGDGSRLASNYLTAVARGQHVQGREFDYVAATPWNRLSFLGAAFEVLLPIARKDVTFTLQDMHSLLLMLCPDVPLRVTRSAFKAATPLLPSGSAVPHLSGDVAKLAFPKLWDSLEVTFLYENFLLELRHIAFEGKSHLLRTVEDVTACLAVAEAAVSLGGWPSIPDFVLQATMQQLGTEGTVQTFHFDALVRGLCSNQDMQLYVKACTAAAQQKRDNALDNIQAILKTFQDPLQDSTNIIRSKAQPQRPPCLMGMTDFVVDTEV